MSPCASFDEIITRITEFAEHNLTRALIGAGIRLREVVLAAQPRVEDLEFRLRDGLLERLPRSHGTGKRRATPQSRGLLPRVVALYAAQWVASTAAIAALDRTNCVSAKSPALGVVRAVSALHAFVLPAEVQVVTAIKAVLGPNFRKFCESCERQDLHRIAQKHQLVLGHARKTKDEAGPMGDSLLWRSVVDPVCVVATALAQEGRKMCSFLPALHVTGSTMRLDLSRTAVEYHVPVRIENSGDGNARAVHMLVRSTTSSAEIKTVEPTVTFDLPAKEGALVTLGVKLLVPTSTLGVEVSWVCTTDTGAEHRDDDTLAIEQQSVQPDWDLLEANPPYPINAIRRREDLFGRDAMLQQLEMNAARGTSSFLWGQKRVGKTSVVQVLHHVLDAREGYLRARYARSICPSCC